MQDGVSRPTADEARQWLKSRPDEFHVSFAWDAEAVPDQGAYERLLEILFAARPDSEAA